MNAFTPARLDAGFLTARLDGLQDLPGPVAPREAARAWLQAHGLPDRRNEAWKYTPLDGLRALASGEAASTPALPALGALADAPRLVFVAGRLDAALSHVPAGFSRFAGLDEHAPSGLIEALNAMLATDGAQVEVPAGVDAGTLVLISLGSPQAASHVRHQIKLAQGARLRVLEIAAGDGAYLHNPWSEISLGAHARLEHVRLQLEGAGAYHLAGIEVMLAADAAYEGFTLSLGAGLARCELTARLEGPGAHATLNAAQLLAGSQHGDFTTRVRHAAPNCTSRQVVKNVLQDRARGVFQGKIEVAQAAQKTDGYQMNQALLLSPDAEINSKPQLEIFADDVKCSHGATVGELDADQLFYLTSRGIAAPVARAMLVEAFLQESLDAVTDAAIRGVLEAALAPRLAQLTAGAP